MTRSPFFPSPRTNYLLIAAGFAAVGWAMYVRYMIIETSVVGLACDAGLATAKCALRRIVIPIYGHGAFGGVALAAAILHLLRPHALLFGLALVLGGIGVVLYNTGLAGLALALLVVSFARPAPSTE